MSPIGEPDPGCGLRDAGGWDEKTHAQLMHGDNMRDAVADNRLDVVGSPFGFQLESAF